MWMDFRNTTAIALATFASVCASAALADVRAGVEAWSRGEHELAVKEWLGPAAQGDADAQFNLGQAYKLGKGVPQDLKRAESYYRKAAASGHIKAADTLGLLMFQDGRKAEALPFLQASAERGEPRAMYILGIAHFNGDAVGKDWVRAYALMNRSAATGLEQAKRALATMDDMIPLEQRQMGVSLAADLEQKAQAMRAQQLASADLGVKAAPTAPLRTTAPGRALEPATLPASTAAGGPVTAGADFANPVAMPAKAKPAPAPSTAAAPSVATGVPKPPAAKAPEPPKAAPALASPPAPATSGGNWRVQLGAFGVKGNADALWSKVRGRPELAGRTRIDLPSGSVTRLLAGGYASQSEADRACAALKAGGLACLVVKP